MERVPASAPNLTHTPPSSKLEVAYLENQRIFALILLVTAFLVANEMLRFTGWRGIFFLTGAA